MSEIPKRTEWQVLFKNFDGSVWTINNVTLRTNKIVGTLMENQDKEILKALSQELSSCKNKIQQHYNEKQQNRATSSPTDSQISFVLDKDNEVQKQLKEMLDDSPTVITDTQEPQNQNQVAPSQIQLYEINENSRLETSIFPLSFRCYKCGHYSIIDPLHPKLTCPCCKESYCNVCRKSINQVGGKCPDCKNDLKPNSLRQFNSVFACPRCANLEELTPRLVRLTNVQGTTIPCQSGKNCPGHMHFHIYESFLSSFWKCETCGDKKNVDKFCKCHIRKDDNLGIAGKPSIMKPITTSAPSITSPLLKSYLYMGNSDVSCTTLQQANEDSKDTDPDRWNIKEETSNIELQIFSNQYGIIDSFTVPNITTMTIVYGYRSGVASYPVRILDTERLAQLFQYGNKYNAYVIKKDGRGLVVSLDKNKILKIIQQNNLTTCQTYEELSDGTLNILKNTEFQNLIENTQNIPLVSVLHSIEHALLKSMMELTGLEDFGSKILIKDCCIVLFQRGDLGIGGISQIARPNQSSEFKRFIMTAAQQLKNCSQRCDDACLACIFMNDFNCQPYLPTEVSRWIPPNSILNRVLANQFFNVI